MKNTKKLLAFKLRLQGYSYKQIANLTGWSEFTLRRYFSPKGQWFHEYKQWSSIELNQIKEDMHTIILSQAIDAAKIIGNMLTSPKPNLALRAAQDILDRAGFQKHNRGFMRSESADDYAEDIMKTMEKLIAAKKDEYENEPNSHPDR